MQPAKRDGWIKAPGSGKILWSLFVFLFFSGSSLAQNNSIVIPVVVHIISSNPDAYLDADILRGVQDLNDAFGHTGPYSTGGGADTRIRFCIARTDPDGGSCIGITRTRSDLGDFDKDIEDDRMKRLASWDPRQYCNIWLVDGVKNEYETFYSCGVWNRKQNSGYATFPGDGRFTDGIVTTGFGVPLVYLTSVYLGLRNTYAGGCGNTNCSVDGDGICDTPPASGPAACGQVFNSCSTDSLSGFTRDMPDATENFMSMNPCANAFTAGQGDRMRQNVQDVRPGLLVNKCDPGCGGNVGAGFTRDNWTPKKGDVVTFTSFLLAGPNFEWTMNGSRVGTNSPVLSQRFADTGLYHIVLKVFFGNPDCYASYSDDVIVNCGVVARFDPDVRQIAVKEPFLVDSISFANRSDGAAAYKWFMDDGSGARQVGAQPDLKYIFTNPGNYSVWLQASNGACTDMTEKFSFPVLDGTMDASLAVTSALCYQGNKVIANFQICNGGYVSLQKGAPVSFYDSDPRLPGAKKAAATWFLPDSVKGNCCANFSDTLTLSVPGLNRLFAVVNDNGSTLPLRLPNTARPERNYDNNVFDLENFQFRVSVSPLTDSLEFGDSLYLQSGYVNGLNPVFTWSPPQDLNCTDCPAPLFIAGKKDEVKKLTGVSSSGCVDSAFVVLHIIPSDDFTVKVDSAVCVSDGRVLVAFTVCNLFKRGVVPPGLPVSVYAGDASAAGARMLSPVFQTPPGSTGQCMSFSGYFGKIDSGKITLVVNDSGVVAPVSLPADTVFREKNYANNSVVFSYAPAPVLLQPADTTVLRNSPVAVKMLSPEYNPASTLWNNGNGYTLSCNNCSLPVATVISDGILTMQSENRYGCMLKGSAALKVFPPDFTAVILETHCFTNDSLLVRFRLCMNNRYDTVVAGLAFSFYDGNPGSGAAQLGPAYYTPQIMPSGCADYQMLIPIPHGSELFLRVNDAGTGQGVLLAETNTANDTASRFVPPFAVQVTPADTSVYRFSPVVLSPAVSGGQLSGFEWEPKQFLNCPGCLQPTAVPPYSLQYRITVRNEYFCTASSTVSVNTYAGGKVSIPNVFTPNHDGKNDIFYVLGANGIDRLEEFALFDRRGRQVFRRNNVPANDPQYGWNGNDAGSASPEGGYVYIVVVRFTDGTVQTYKGSVILVR